MKERSGGRSAACATCGKTFARSDTLLRHEKSHHATEDRGPVHRVTNGTFRACSACASARSRCSGGAPCGRCNLRKMECVYPSKRRKGTAEGQMLNLDASPNEPTMNPFQDVSFAASNQIRFATSQPSLSNPDTSPGHRQPPGDIHHFGEQSPYRESLRHDSMHSHHDEPVPPAVDFPRVPQLSSQVGPHQQYSESSLSGNFQPDFGTAPYDYSSFEEPMNWIPISVYPSPFENEFEHDISFLLPPLSDSPAIGFDYNTGAPYDAPGQLYKAAEQTSQLDDQGHPGDHTFRGPQAGAAQSPASSASNEHPTTKSTTSSAETGERRKRRKSSYVPDDFAKPRIQKGSFGFPDLSLPENALYGTAGPFSYCSQDKYGAITDAFGRLCLDTNTARPFESAKFPDVDSLNLCIDLYFKNFHETFPLIHRPTFGSDAEWIVLLAVAAIGSSFYKGSCTVQLRDAFQELLRRAIRFYADGVGDSLQDLSLAHSQILNLVGLTLSDRESLRCLAPRYHADLSRWCLESGALQISKDGELGEPESSHSNGCRRSWERWIRVESLRRIGYLSWLLDTSLGYIANCRPLCNMDDARTPLPCSEALWGALDPEEWMARYKETETPPSLCEALEFMYAKKAIDPRLSDLSQILIINALFQRTWEVGTHIKQPLSEWVPTGKARGFLNTPSKDSFWLPLYPLYANWRNSACDCLDVIHWQAASNVAKASGVEHDLMLHLHLARIILLTPFQEIQDLLFSLIGRVGHASRASFYVHDGSYQPRNLAKLSQIRKITWRWLREDQHKARLAMVHAGSVFWHVRRYSSTSLYEPLAVYLASMVLWTYGSYKSAALGRDAAANSSSKPVGGPSGPDSDLSTVQPSRVERKVSQSSHHLNPSLQPHADHGALARRPSNASPISASDRGPHSPSAASESSSESEDQMPQFIHLDRPCDDEMIQHFVRNGHNMSPHMASVGDICKTPNKVLIEGAKLLRTRLGCWGVSREYYDILTRLAEVAGKKSSG